MIKQRNATIPVLSALALALAMPAMAQEAKPVSTVLINNANILDSNQGTLAERMSLLAEGNKIAKIAKSIPAPDGATVIDAKDENAPSTRIEMKRRNPLSRMRSVAPVH